MKLTKSAVIAGDPALLEVMALDTPGLRGSLDGMRMLQGKPVTVVEVSKETKGEPQVISESNANVICMICSLGDYPRTQDELRTAIRTARLRLGWEPE